MSLFHTYCARITCSTEPLKSNEIKKIEAFFSDYVLESTSFNEILQVLLAYCSHEMGQNVSCILFSAQLFHKICSKNSHIDVSSDEVIGYVIEKILVITNACTVTGLLIPIIYYNSIHLLIYLHRY